MSTSYWGIDGLGLEIEVEYLDLDKCVNFIEKNMVSDSDLCDLSDEFILDSTDFSDFLKEIVAHFGNKNIVCEYGCNADTGHYILFTPSYPWQLTSDDLQITEEKAKELIYQCIKPIIKDELSKEFIFDNIDYISTYGCG